MRKQVFTMSVIFNEDEVNYGNKDDIIGSLEHEMFNIDGIREWSVDEISNEEIEYDDSEWQD